MADQFQPNIRPKTPQIPASAGYPPPAISSEKHPASIDKITEFMSLLQSYIYNLQNMYLRMMTAEFIQHKHKRNNGSIKHRFHD